MYLSGYVPTLGVTGWLGICIVFVNTKRFLVTHSSKKGPPRPISLPIVGSLLSLPDKDIRKSLSKLAVEYGDVMQVDLGLSRAIVLSSHEAIKEAFVKQSDNYVFRPLGTLPNCRMELGVVSQNDHWTQHRAFILHTLRNFGIGKNRMELVIQEELSNLIQTISQVSDTMSHLDAFFYKISSMVVLRLIFGRSLSYDDPFLLRHIRFVEELTTISEKTMFTDFFPFLEYIPGGPRYKKQAEDKTLQIRDIAMEWIKERKKTIDYDSEPSDFIEAYLQEQRRIVNIDATRFTDEMLAYHVLDLHAAGAETTGVTLTFAIYRMILHPHVQAKVQTEIDEIVGSRPPCLHDRINMPYTEAVLSEVQRISDVVPLALPHTNNRESEIKGYTIPQWSKIIINIHHVHRDPAVRPDPEKFDPNRFLNSYGKFRKRDELIPFGMGKRNCLGEILARSELFLIFVGVLQQFSFRTLEGGTEADPEGNAGFVMHPKPADVVIESRHKTFVVWNSFF